MPAACTAGGLGTVAERLLRKTSDDCTAAGKPALDIVTNPDKPSGMRLVQTGRADLMLTDGGFSGNVAKTNAADFALAGTIRTDFKVGSGIAKTEPELREGIAAALQQLQADAAVAALMA